MKNKTKKGSTTNPKHEAKRKAERKLSKKMGINSLAWENRKTGIVNYVLRKEARAKELAEKRRAKNEQR